jgi:hypothetical protein
MAQYQGRIKIAADVLQGDKHGRVAIDIHLECVVMGRSLALFMAEYLKGNGLVCHANFALLGVVGFKW